MERPLFVSPTIRKPVKTKTDCRCCGEPMELIEHPKDEGEARGRLEFVCLHLGCAMAVDPYVRTK